MYGLFGKQFNVKNLSQSIIPLSWNCPLSKVHLSEIRSGLYQYILITLAFHGAIHFPLPEEYSDFVLIQMHYMFLFPQLLFPHNAPRVSRKKIFSNNNGMCRPNTSISQVSVELVWITKHGLGL